MPARDEQLDLRCSTCGWSERCDLSQMHTALQRAGMLRRANDPEPSLVLELFRQSAGKFNCPECDAPLSVREVDDADWGAAVECEGCQQPIPAARLAAAPAATLCAACQQRVDRGEPVGLAEYCSHCGGIMVLKRATKGITRYVERCSECGR
jgi:hypothetical protein